jgi:hypothetical protein
MTSVSISNYLVYFAYVIIRFFSFVYLIIKTSTFFFMDTENGLLRGSAGILE